MDEAIGGFDTLGRYRSYLHATHAFRRAVEAELSGHDGWDLQPIADLVAADLNALGETPRSNPFPLRLDPRPSSQLGALYVLEGSAVGARLLYRRALSLGLSGDRGARHLAEQDSDRERWPRFLQLLDGAAGVDVQQAQAAAAAVFDLACSIYLETTHA